MSRYVLLLALCTGSALAADGAEFHQDHRRVGVAEGIFSFIATESPGGVLQGNVTVIAGSDATLVVDSGQYPSLARRMVAAIEVSGLPPVRWLVNTHWHGDHLLSNAVFTAAWPQATVVQHKETARLGAVYYADWAETAASKNAEAIAGLEKALAEGVNSEGKPLTDADRAGMEATVAMARHWLADADDTGWSPPTLAFEGELALDLGGRRVAVRHAGLANTTGDIVVWDAATRTLVTGDIVVHPTPYSFGSFHSEWIDTLAALRALEPARIVPGHGEVMHDDAYLQRLEALLAETRAQVRAGIADGLTLEQVREQVTLAEFEKEFAGDDPARIRAFRSFYLRPGIEQAWKEARGEPRSK